MEDTGLRDSKGKKIVIGSIIRKPVEINQDVHGKWTEMVVKRQGMTPILSYLRSEKGDVLPEGYIACLLAEEYDRKMFVFATKPETLRPMNRVIVVGHVDD